MKAFFFLLLFFWPFFAHFSSGSGKKIRWCTLSEAEQRKCADWSRAMAAMAAASVSRISCVRVRNVRDCLDKIRANKADAATLDAGDAYSGVKIHGLAFAAKEVYAEGSCVFSVAVARRGSVRTLPGLRGSRSCHSASKWTSGWTLPLAFLSKNAEIPSETSLEPTAAGYFSAGCVPGASDPRLCQICRGAASPVAERRGFCQKSGREPFYGNDGALRCLASGAASVAFVDHLALVNASDPELEGFELLCPDGTKAPLTNYGGCHLGRGPGRAVVTRRSFRKDLRGALDLAQDLFGRNGSLKPRFELFSSSSSNFRGKDLLFSDAVLRLSPVPEDADVGRLFGADYVSLLQSLGHEGRALSDRVVRWCCVGDAETRKCEDWALGVRSDPLVCVRAASKSGCLGRIKNNEADAVVVDALHAFLAKKCALFPVAVEKYDADPAFAVAVVAKSLRNANLSCRLSSAFADFFFRKRSKRPLSGNFSGAAAPVFLELNPEFLQNLQHFDDFDLLCPNGSRAAILRWRECRFGPVPPGLVVARTENAGKIRKFLRNSQNSDFGLFGSEKYGGSGLLFREFGAVFGADFARLAEDFLNCAPDGILDFCQRDPCAEI